MLDKDSSDNNKLSNNHNAKQLARVPGFFSFLPPSAITVRCLQFYENHHFQKTPAKILFDSYFGDIVFYSHGDSNAI